MLSQNTLQYMTTYLHSTKTQYSFLKVAYNKGMLVHQHFSLLFDRQHSTATDIHSGEIHFHQCVIKSLNFCEYIYSTQSGKKADLNDFRLKHVAKQVSSVIGMSSKIPIAPSLLASHLSMILSTDPMIFKTPLASHGSSEIAFSSSDLSSFLFPLVSRYFAAQRMICGRDGHEGSSQDPATHVSSAAETNGVMMTDRMREIRMVKRVMFAFMLNLLSE